MNPTQEEPLPSWARAFVEEMQALNRKLNQHDNEDENLESLEEPIPTWARALMEEIDQIDMRAETAHGLWLSRMKPRRSNSSTCRWSSAPCAGFNR